MSNLVGQFLHSYQQDHARISNLMFHKSFLILEYGIPIPLNISLTKENKMVTLAIVTNFTPINFQEIWGEKN